MADDTTTGDNAGKTPTPRSRSRRTATRAPEPGLAEGAAAEAALADSGAAAAAVAEPAPKRRTTRRKAADPAADATPAAAPEPAAGAAPAADAAAPAGGEPPKRRRSTRTAAAEPSPATEAAAASEAAVAAVEPPAPRRRASRTAGPPTPSAPPAAAPDAAAPAAETAAAPAGRRTVPPPVVVFQPPVPAAPAPAASAGEPAEAAAETDADAAEPRGRRRRTPRIAVADAAPKPARAAEPEPAAAPGEAAEAEDEDDETAEHRKRRRRGRRGRGRGKTNGEDAARDDDEEPAEAPEPAAAAAEPAAEGDDDQSGGTRRRRRRRRGGGGEGAEPVADDPVRTVVRVREPRTETEVQGVKGSTRLEAKRQRRREGRDQGRRRPAIVSEAEFLARREAVDRVMLVRQGDGTTQIAVLEDGVLVEHYVTRAEATSYAGNVYLGRVQNVLASMEAAFVDIGKGRNAVLYAGEVNYDASALEGRPPRIEQALKSGQQIVVQVTKDPMGHKGARLTSQVSLPGRYMVYVPEQSMTGISRKLPDTERARLKGILKNLKPEGGGIIIRTAAEGASEEDLTADLRRLQAQWEVIQKKIKKETAPALLHAEPDLVIRVIRDTFNEDFRSLVVEGDRDYDLIEGYLSTLAPDLLPRLERWTGDGGLFEGHRVDEQLAKGLDRKVSLPSGGSLVIDRTEAMTVVDVNTGKFTGKGGNLEETVTKNNLEAAEEIVRQLRLRDIGGIIVVDFIDMILESNRELVMRRLKECLGRDRTKHQVAEITSLGLLQMTRKRIGQGLVEAFTEPCAECGGRGIKIRPEFPQAGGRKQQQHQHGGGTAAAAGNGGNGGGAAPAGGGSSSGSSGSGGGGKRRGGKKAAAAAPAGGDAAAASGAAVEASAGVAAETG